MGGISIVVKATEIEEVKRLVVAAENIVKEIKDKRYTDLWDNTKLEDKQSYIEFTEALNILKVAADGTGVC